MRKTRIDRINQHLRFSRRDRPTGRSAMFPSHPNRQNHPRRLTGLRESDLSAQPLPQVDDTIFTVVQWKNEIDLDSPWWKRLYYKLIYCPFMEFSLKVVKLPKPTEATIEGKKVHFSWLEIQEHFSSADEADLACVGERWGYKDYPFGRSLPSSSGQVGNGPVFPRARNPRKRIKPIMEMTILPRRRITKLEGEVARLHQVLDR